MTVQGHIEDGQVVLDGLLNLPNGTKVAVSVEAHETKHDAAQEHPTLYERLKSVVGKAEGLPPDMAINHDHYLHGTPKRQ